MALLSERIYKIRMTVGKIFTVLYSIHLQIYKGANLKLVNAYAVRTHENRPIKCKGSLRLCTANKIALKLL